MRYRIAAFSVALIAVSAATAFAQAPPTPPVQGQGQGGGGGGGGAARRMQALLEGITLTAPQQAKFDSIQTAYRGQMPAFTPGARSFLKTSI